MAGFKCPFCGQFMSLGSMTEHVYRLNFENFVDQVRFPDRPHIELRIFSCPNETCKKETVVAYGRNGYMENIFCPIYPKSVFNHYPEYVPLAIRKDYEEARTIQKDSPKASATLARRCLQGMIRDFWKIKKDRLFDEINELQGKVSATQWAAIDALRRIGNIGAHMEKDVNLMIDVEPEEADLLLQLIELLIEKWYIDRHDEEGLYTSITTLGEAKKSAKNPK